METVGSGANLDRGSLIDCIAHTAGRKTVPDQAVQAELVPAQGILDHHRGTGDV